MHRRARSARGRARDRERDRPERRGEDDALQPRDRHLPAGLRRHPLRRTDPARARAAPDHRTRHRAHVPDAAPVPESDRQGERDGGGVLAHACRHPSVGPAHAGMRREEREIEQLAEERLVVLRPAPDGLPLEPARVLAVVRKPAAARDRAGDGDEAASAAPRRAGGGHEPGRDARDHGADRAPSCRGRLHDPRDRARHARGRGNLRPRDRARSRHQDLRGHVRPRCHRPARRRGISRHERDEDQE